MADDQLRDGYAGVPANGTPVGCSPGQGFTWARNHNPTCIATATPGATSTPIPSGTPTATATVTATPTPVSCAPWTIGFTLYPNSAPSCVMSPTPTASFTPSPSPAPTAQHAGVGSCTDGAGTILNWNVDAAPSCITPTPTQTATVTPTPTQTFTPTATATAASGVGDVTGPYSANLVNQAHWNITALVATAGGGATPTPTPVPVAATNTVLTCNATNAPASFLLPAATGSGRYLFLSKRDTTVNACAFNGNGGDTIDGLATATLLTRGTVQLVDIASGAWVRVQDNALQFVVNPRGTTTTPACDWSLGYICTFDWSLASATISTSNIPPAGTNVIIQAKLTSGGARGLVFPSTIRTVQVSTGAMVASATIDVVSPGTFTFLCSSDGTNLDCLGLGSDSYGDVSAFTAGRVGTGGIQINSDTTMTTAPRGAYFFDVSESAALPGTGTLIDCVFIEKTETVTKITLSVNLFTCSGNPTFLVEDCGTTVNSCSSPTTIGTASPSATGVSNVTVSSSALTASHYICGNVSAGTCTVFSGAYQVTYKGT